VEIFLLTQEKAINSLMCTVEIFLPNFDAIPEMNLYNSTYKGKVTDALKKKKVLHY